MEDAVERGVCRPHPQSSVQYDQRFAEGGDKALSVRLGNAGGLLSVLQIGHVDKRNHHAVNEILYCAVGEHPHKVAGVDIPHMKVSFLCGKRTQHVLGLADDIGADEALGKVGDWPTGITRGEPHDGAGGRCEAADTQLGVQEESRDLGAIQQVLQVVISMVEGPHFPAEFSVHRLQFFVERLQFLL